MTRGWQLELVEDPLRQGTPPVHYGQRTVLDFGPGVSGRVDHPECGALGRLRHIFTKLAVAQTSRKRLDNLEACAFDVVNVSYGLSRPL